MANNGPHGGYSEATNRCPICHRLHGAAGGTILADTTTYGLCVSCHGRLGLGANTDVINGVWMGSGGPAPLNGGGFDTIGAIITVTSMHGVRGLHQSSGVGVAWGGGDHGPGTEMLLECVSCHNPHGNDSYRILLSGPVRVTTTELTPTYTATNYGRGISAFCARCHTQYSVQNSVYDTGDQYGYIGRFRHPVDVSSGHNGYKFDTCGLPLGEGYEMNCLTCHFAHGTPATVSGVAGERGPAKGSVLLRADNRGVCQRCHVK